MKRPTTGRQQATFPPDYELSGATRLIWPLASRSRRVRAFFFGLPYSRLRTYFVARYYHQLMTELARGRFGLLKAVAPDAEFTLFGLETHRGRDSWRSALSDWIDSLAPLRIEVGQFIDVGNHRDVLLIVRMGGTGASSRVTVDEEVYFVLRVTAGMATESALFQEKAAALEAAGLSE